MTIKVLSFEQALKKADNYGMRHLLLGNGFSIACKPDIFAYGSLFEDPRSKSNLIIRANVERIAALRPGAFPALSVDFFDAASAKVWG